jgi:hypothetical protein
MRHINKIWRCGNRWLLALACWLAGYGLAFAEAQPKPAEPAGGNYVMEYGLVILAIALGLMTVLRPARRRDRAQPQAYDEIKFKAKD